MAEFNDSQLSADIIIKNIRFIPDLLGPRGHRSRLRKLLFIIL